MTVAVPRLSGEPVSLAEIPAVTKRMVPPVEDEAGDGLVAIDAKRCFSYRSLGDRDGYPLIALHGTPGSRLKFVAAHASAKRLGIRLIAPDRWGYGATTAHHAPSLSAFADDICRLADRLGLGKFGVLGVSGGGPFAVAVAASMAERVSSLSLVAPVGPIAGEPDDEITPFHRLCFGALSQRPKAVGAVFQAFRAMLDVSPDVGVRVAMLRIAAADRRVLWRREVATHLGETFAEGLRPGVVGPVTDLGLFGTRWDIDLCRAHVPAHMWLGSADQNVPRSAARRLADRLPDCGLTELAGEGHLWIADNFETVLEWAAAQTT
ncbi:MAG: alpha/beta fold hydrolase [Hyphomicrobiaceae bacterium]